MFLHSTVGRDTNAYLRENFKVSVFENGQFRGHLIFDKKTVFFRNFVFLKNKYFPFFEKMCFFWKCFFKKIKNHFDKFFVVEKF